MTNRKTSITRKTKETDISLTLNIDGTGNSDIKTPIPFFTHMLESFARHGFFDLKIKATGDVDVDDHHLVEDVGLVLGQAFNKALGDKKGINRFGSFVLPMDEVLTMAVCDISGRPCFINHSKTKLGKIKKFDLDLVHEFFQALVNTFGLNLHLKILSPGNKHHMVESLFKACARALDMATKKDNRVSGVPSTKGSL